MRPRLHTFLRAIARSLMLLAALAFVQQGALVAATQVAAATGLLPQPAVTLSGPSHVHGDIVRQAHVHAGNNAAGHVHDADDSGHEKDEATGAPMWCLSLTSAVVPTVAACAVPANVATVVEAPPHGRLIGIEPDGLNRPPSTPRIA